MKLNKRFEVTIGGMICLVGPIVVLSVVATWAFFKAGEWEASNAMAAQLTKTTALNESEAEEVSDLRTRVFEQGQGAAQQKAAYEKEIADDESADAESIDQLKERVKSLTARNKKLTDALAAATGVMTSIKVPTGEARFIAGDRVAVGVEAIADAFATVRIGDYPSINMVPGESRAVQLGDDSFVVTLMKVESTGCVFAVKKA